MKGISQNKRPGANAIGCPGDAMSKVLVCLTYLMTSIGVTSAASSEFITTNGAILKGEISRASPNTVTINLSAGGPFMIARREISSISMTIDDVGKVTGAFEDFRDGTYKIRTDNRLLHIRDGILLTVDELVPVDNQIVATRAKETLLPPASPVFVSVDAGAGNYNLAGGLPTTLTYSETLN